MSPPSSAGPESRIMKMIEPYTIISEMGHNSVKSNSTVTEAERTYADRELFFLVTRICQTSVAALVNQIVKKQMGDFTFDKSLKIFYYCSRKIQAETNKLPIIRL
jgi:hypothetical protein